MNGQGPVNLLVRRIYKKGDRRICSPKNNGIFRKYDVNVVITVPYDFKSFYECGPVSPLPHLYHRHCRQPYHGPFLSNSTVDRERLDENTTGTGSDRPLTRSHTVPLPPDLRRGVANDTRT